MPTRTVTVATPRFRVFYIHCSEAGDAQTPRFVSQPNFLSFLVKGNRKTITVPPSSASYELRAPFAMDDIGVTCFGVAMEPETIMACIWARDELESFETQQSFSREKLDPVTLAPAQAAAGPIITFVNNQAFREIRDA